MKLIHTSLVVAVSLMSLTACNGGLPNVLNAHPAPRPPAATPAPTMAASVALSLSSPVNLTAAGVYPVAISVKDANGTVIPAGTVLANPVVLSSNNSASIGLSLSLTTTTTSSNKRAASQKRVALDATPVPSATPTPLASASPTAAPVVIATLAPVITTTPTVPVASVTMSVVQPLVYLTFTPTGVTTGLVLTATTPNIAKATTLAISPANSTPTPMPTSIPPTTVATVSLGLSAPVNLTTSGTYTVVVGLKDANGAAIPAGTVLANPIVVTSNVSSEIGLSLTANGNSSGSVSISTAQPQLYLTYTAGSVTTGLVVTATTPNISTATQLPISPGTPGQNVAATATVGSVGLALSATPNLAAAGTYSVVVTLKDNTGAVIPTGTALTNQVVLTTNAASSIGLSLTQIGTPTTSVTLAAGQSIVYVTYTASACSSAACLSPVITATTSGLSTATNLSILAPITVGAVSLSLLGTVDLTQKGTYSVSVHLMDVNGFTIPVGTSLANPVVFSTNNSGAVGFSLNTNYTSTSTSTVSMSVVQSFVYVQYTALTPLPASAPIITATTPGLALAQNFTL